MELENHLFRICTKLVYYSKLISPVPLCRYYNTQDFGLQKTFCTKSRSKQSKRFLSFEEFTIKRKGQQNCPSILSQRANQNSRTKAKMEHMEQ